METQIIQIQNTKYTKYRIYKKQNIQKIEFGNTKDGKTEYTKMKYGNTKDGNIFTSSAPLIYGDYYTKLRGRTLTKCNICFYSPFTINANRTTISSVEKCARSYLSLWPYSQTCKNGFIQYINRFLYIDYVCVSCLNPPSS